MAMGFIKRILGLETKPGEPASLTDREFNDTIEKSGVPCFVYFFHLWCSSCQVMGGLLNEIGPEYSDRAVFYKLDVNKNPESMGRANVSAVPTIIAYRNGTPVDRHSGLIPLNPLKAWIEKNLEGPGPAEAEDGGGS